jgi:molybdenum cofactor cytidylyltransferase
MPMFAPSEAVSALFDPAPSQWGLRGDPYLWQAMQRALATVARPSTAASLAALIESAFEQLTGHPMATNEPIYAPEYSHGGMSSGLVSPPFWREVAIPLLVQRWSERL